MTKVKLMYFNNLLLAISFLVVTVTGFIKWKGLLGKFGVDTSGFDWKTISLIHDWSGAVMAAFVLFHLILNWAWIVEITKSFFDGKKK